MADERVALFQKHLKEGKTIEEAKKLALGAEIKTEANVMGVKATPTTLSTALSGQAPIQGIESKMNPYMTTKPAPIPARPETIKEVVQRRSGAPRAQTMQEIAGPKATPTIGMRTGEDPTEKGRAVSKQAEIDTYKAPITSLAGQLGGEAILGVGAGGLSLARGVSESFGASDTAKYLGETQKALSQTQEQFVQRGEGVRKAAQRVSENENDWLQSIQASALRGLAGAGGVSNALAGTAQFAGQGLGNTASAVSGLYGGGQMAGETGEMLGGAITGGKEALAQQAGKSAENLTFGDIAKGVTKAGLRGASNVGKILQDPNQSLRANEMVGNVIGSTIPVGAIGKFNEVVDPINILAKGAKAGVQAGGKVLQAAKQAMPGIIQAGQKGLQVTGQVLGKTGEVGMAVLKSPYTLTKRVIDSKPVSNLIKNTAVKELGMEGSSISRMMEKPDLIKAFEEGAITREGLSSSVQSEINQAVDVLDEGNVTRKAIRASGDFVPQNTLDKGLLKWAKDKGMTLTWENGKPTIDFVGSGVKDTERNIIQKTLDDMYEASNRKGGLDASTYLNIRGGMDTGIGYESAAAKETLKDIRKSINREVREAGHIAGLVELDDSQSAILQILENIEKETGIIKEVKGRWTITDTGESKLANLLNKNNRQKLEALEKYIPGITEKIQDLSAVEDLSRVMTSQKTGTYTAGNITKNTGRAIGTALGSFIPGLGNVGGFFTGEMVANTITPLMKIKLMSKLLGAGKSVEEVESLLKNPGKLSQVLEKSKENLVKAGSELPLGGTKAPTPQPLKPIQQAPVVKPQSMDTGEIPQ